MDEGLGKYRHFQEFMDAAHTDLHSSLRIVDTILDAVRLPANTESHPELCREVQYLADRLRFFITSRLAALEDLIVILRGHGIEIPVSSDERDESGGRT
jgi:hypothetical protein